uniref:Cilia- and flagella-associated protein 43 n=1 Tax=Periophthalmus magnuspinnatus TaxID=409849 RepID=A0A3B3ZVU6_9GOBI
FTANGNSGIFAFSPRGLNPSIFVHSHPSLGLKNELAGELLDYISLALSDGGPYLVSCSSLPDYTITVWNWENATPLCQQERGGNSTCSLVFNPWNWLQICALDKSTLTVWNIERNVELPDADGAIVKRFVLSSHSVNEELCYYGPELPPSAIAGLKGDKTEDINKIFRKARVTPAVICWTATSHLYVGCKEGFLLLVDPEHLSVSILFDPKSNFNLLIQNTQQCLSKQDLLFYTLILTHTLNSICIALYTCPVTTVLYSPNYETLLCTSDMVMAYIPNHDISFLKMLHNLIIFNFFRITSMACCPIANYVVLGTACGKVLFTDVRDPQQPRIVHQTHLYHTSVDHLV